RAGPELQRVLGDHDRLRRGHLDPGHRRRRQRGLLLGYLSLLDQRGEKQWSKHAGIFPVGGIREIYGRGETEKGEGRGEKGEGRRETGEGRGEKGEGRRERGEGRGERVIPTERRRREWREG